MRTRLPRPDATAARALIARLATISALLLILASVAPPLAPSPAAADDPPTPGERLFALLARPTPAQGPDWHREIAGIYQTLGQEEAALAHWRVAAEATDDLALWRRLATAYRDQARWDAAREALDAVLRLAPDDPTAHYELGVLLAPHDVRQAYQHLARVGDEAALGGDARAIQATIVATQLENPAYASAQLGLTLASLAHWPQAEQAFELAVALDPGYAEAWAYLGMARAQQGKEGLTASERALALAPANPLVVYLGGLVWRASGDIRQSRLALAEALRLEPENPAFAAELGAAYRLEGDLAAAEAWLQTAVSLAAGEGEFLTLLALFYADETFNLDGDGLTAIQEALARAPEDADLQAAYGWALYNLGEFPAAVDALEVALALDPANPRALYYRGLLYEQEGHHDQAITTLLGLLDHPQPAGFDALARRALERFAYAP